MPPTTLSFWRKRQTLSSLGNERPQSLQAVHGVLAQAVDDVESALDVVKRLYYGNGQPETEIRHWRHAITSVMAAAGVTEINWMWQIDAMEEKVVIPGEQPLVNISNVHMTGDAVAKVMLNVPSAFDGCIQALENILKYAAKYCLSFCNSKLNDPYVECALHYDSSRKGFVQKIRACIDGIGELAPKFKTTGLRFGDFSPSVQELGYKTQTAQIPFLLIFPECVEKVRSACAALKKWIDLDSSYASFVKFDLAELEKKLAAQAKLVREEQDKIYAMEYRFQAAKREHSALEKEITRLLRKNDKLMDDEARAVALENNIKLELDVKVLRKADIKKNADSMSPAEYNEQHDRLVSEIKNMKVKLQSFRRDVENIHSKQVWINEKRDRGTAARKKLDEVIKELKQNRSEYRKMCVELERIEACVNSLKRVYTLKTNPETLKKIFHGLPLLNSKHQSPGSRKKIDALDRAIRVAARFIDKDWIVLYRSLPFFPTRGDELLSSDIADIDQSNFRGITVDLARQSLERWRRLHTRANMADLKNALLAIKRADIVNEIDLALIPKTVKKQQKLLNRQRRQSNSLHQTQNRAQLLPVIN
ncbi:uncharacterized protein LOC141910378 [Tubulanus polymorphus]|uniref:uncharacterized protein LOC141910378 n=1 Tax=Tubulanus polymorphus TaxID=672921 RepID=UPI003DA66E7A